MPISCAVRAPARTISATISPSGSCASHRCSRLLRLMDRVCTVMLSGARLRSQVRVSSNICRFSPGSPAIRSILIWLKPICRAILKELRQYLRDNGRDQSVADQAEQEYKKMKSDLTSELTGIVYNSAVGSGDGGKWIQEHIEHKR